MADRALKLEVITPDRVVLSDGEVVSVTAPGVGGYMGVLVNHAPVMTELAVGELDFRRVDGSTDAMAVSGGFMEVYENTITVLAETAERRGEIDIRRAEEALLRAERRLAAHPPEVDIDRAQAALLRALNRLRVAQSAS